MNYFVRTAEHEVVGRSEKLTEKGLWQAQKAAVEIAKLTQQKHLGKNALLLCSSIGGAVQTAEVIGERTGLDVLVSPRIAVYGKSPEKVGDLKELFRKAALEKSRLIEEHDGLVVVTHQPLIHSVIYGALATASDYGEPVLNGQVVAFNQGGRQGIGFLASRAFGGPIVNESVDASTHDKVNSAHSGQLAA